MGGPHCKRKTIMQGSGRYHEKRWNVKIDGDGPVFTGLAGSAAHGSPSGQMVAMADDPRWTHAFPISSGWGRRRGFTTKLGGMCHFLLW